MGFEGVLEGVGCVVRGGCFGGVGGEWVSACCVRGRVEVFGRRRPWTGKGGRPKAWAKEVVPGWLSFSWENVVSVWDASESGWVEAKGVRRGDSGRLRRRQRR